MYATVCASAKEITVVQPEGPINAANAAAFRAELYQAVESATSSPLLVDMQKVDFLDSAGLMVLVSALSRAQKVQRKFGLCSVAPAIKMIFELTQLERVFELHESLAAFEAAIDNID
jgi:anti-anti-sigma factor